MCKKSFCLIVFVLMLAMVAVPAFAADYHIDPVDGNDVTGNGSLANPWKSFKNIMKYYSSSFKPPGWVNLLPGETVYLMNGVHNTILHPGGGGGPDDGGSFLIYYRTKHGNSDNRFHLKPYPGHNPILDPQENGIAVYLHQSSWWEIEGLVVRNSSGRGVFVGECSEVKVHNIHIYDTNGVDNNNIAGLYISSSTNVEVYDSIFNDNYDRICADTGGTATSNSCNAVVFSGSQGGNITIHDCNFYQSLPLTDSKSGAGLKYKHASRIPDQFFHVYNNVFTNHKFFSFGSGTANTHFHHNIINGGGTIVSKDFGGTTHQVNQVFEYNTIYGGRGFAFTPTTNWINAEFPDDPCNIIYRNNIVYDTTTSYSSERAIVSIGTYITDVLYYLTLPELTFTRNCYYNPNTAAQFNIAAGFNYKLDYAQGGQYNLADWQSTYGYDLNSLEADPLFVDAIGGNFRLQPCSPCAAMGAHAGDFDDTGAIDWADVKVICDNWLQTSPCIVGDLNGDDNVNFPDFAEFANIWAIRYQIKPSYELKVNSGTGDGFYKESDVVPINADVIGGLTFDVWTGQTAGIDDIYAANTSLTMPSSDVEITATYTGVPTYSLTVNSGSGTGNYEEDEVVPITAAAAQPGDEFSHWTGDTDRIANIFLASTTITMPPQPTTITATYKPIGSTLETKEFGNAIGTDYPGTVEDTYANVGYDGDDNYSTDSLLNTYTWPADTVANTIMIKWDLSTVPTNATVVEARLHMYQVLSSGDTTYDMGVHKIINVNPVISALTWNTYDGATSWTGGANGGLNDIAAAEDTPTVNNTGGEYKIWSVTNMAQDWITTPSSNYGMLVNSDDLASADSFRFFASSEEANSAIRPKLVITYIIPGS